MKHFIKFNGKSSLDLHLYLDSNSMQHVSAQNDVEEVEVLGRDGTVIVDHKRLKPVVQPYELFLKLPPRYKMQRAIDEISEWLSPVGYVDFEKSWDGNYIYRAAFNETYSVSETLSYFGKVALTFKLHPIKYLKSGRQLLEVQNNGSLVNPTKRISKPTLHVAGNGNVKITITSPKGKQELTVKNMERKIIIDCENELAYTEDGSAMLSIFGDDFFHLDLGTSKVSWDNPAVRVWVQTNWGVKV